MESGGPPTLQAPSCLQLPSGTSCRFRVETDRISRWNGTGRRRAQPEQPGGSGRVMDHITHYARYTAAHSTSARWRICASSMRLHAALVLDCSLVTAALAPCSPKDAPARASPRLKQRDLLQAVRTLGRGCSRPWLSVIIEPGPTASLLRRLYAPQWPASLDLPEAGCWSRRQEQPLPGGDSDHLVTVCASVAELRPVGVILARLAAP